MFLSFLTFSVFLFYVIFLTTAYEYSYPQDQICFNKKFRKPVCGPQTPTVTFSKKSRKQCIPKSKSINGKSILLRNIRPLITPDCRLRKLTLGYRVSGNFLGKWKIEFWGPKTSFLIFLLKQSWSFGYEYSYSGFKISTIIKQLPKLAKIFSLFLQKQIRQFRKSQ